MRSGICTSSTARQQHNTAAAAAAHSSSSSSSGQQQQQQQQRTAHQQHSSSMYMTRLYTSIHAKPKPKFKSGAITESTTALNVDQTNDYVVNADQKSAAMLPLVAPSRVGNSQDQQSGAAAPLSESGANCSIEACIMSLLMPRSQIDIFVQVLQANADLNYAEDSDGGPDVIVGILPKLNKETLLQVNAYWIFLLHLWNFLNVDLCTSLCFLLCHCYSYIFQPEKKVILGEGRHLIGLKIKVWWPQDGHFCERISGSLVGSFGAIFIFILLILLSISWFASSLISYRSVYLKLM